MTQYFGRRLFWRRSWESHRVLKFVTPSNATQSLVSSVIEKVLLEGSNTNGASRNKTFCDGYFRYMETESHLVACTTGIL